jgi:predicted TIM-barrel fold metal-dependent hydrolase
VIVDAQVHTYAVHSPQYPWARELPDIEPLTVTGNEMVAAMDTAGVDRAILVSPRNVYQTDTRYAEHVYLEYPDRFRLVAPVNPHKGDPAARVDSWGATPGAVGTRLFFPPRSDIGAEHPGVAATIERSIAAGFPVSVLCWERLPVMHHLARAFPDAQFLLDHLGLFQPIVPPAPDDPFADLADVLALATHPNVAVKLTGVCTYSHRPFPYDDLWEPVARVIDAFGIERCLWGSDWQRATRILSYDEAVSAFRDHWPLTGDERDALMGGNTLRIYGW